MDRRSGERSHWVCDLHTHTVYSRDGLTSLETFLRACRRKGLDRVAVTDHNTIEGALQLKEMDPERIIVGQEIYTTRGELIAYFLRRPIPAGLSPEESIDRVHEQGGVVGISHPLDRLRREAMRRATFDLLDRIDFLEGFNARCLFPADNDAARALALQHGLPVTAGSDAHTPWEIGRAVVTLPPFDSPAAFLESLRDGEIQGRISPPWLHVFSTYAKIAHRLGWTSTPATSEEDR
ncbi:MAG TPA: PHP domain-containing protein [Chloroflexi bacterium]|nr:PHP domain-containing protein [Chloroflexota bacterium]